MKYNDISSPEIIILSRTDGIGDVVLTLPLARALKNKFPLAKIALLGKEYTREIALASAAIDEFILVDDFQEKVILPEDKSAIWIVHVFPVKQIAARAKELGIAVRIGTKSRLFHFLNCNVRVPLHRYNSDLHEAQLNIKLVQDFCALEVPKLKELNAENLLDKPPVLKPELRALLSEKSKNIILHPGSHGSASEWPQKNYAQLAKQLHEQNFQVFISGTKQDGEAMTNLLREVEDSAINLTGKLSLQELIAFISYADGLVACSTGPLHIAAGLGKVAIGLYPARRPIFARRWAPIGQKAVVISASKFCEKCAKKNVKCRLHGKHCSFRSERCRGKGFS